MLVVKLIEIQSKNNIFMAGGGLYEEAAGLVRAVLKRMRLAGPGLIPYLRDMIIN